MYLFLLAETVSVVSASEWQSRGNMLELLIRAAISSISFTPNPLHSKSCFPPLCVCLFSVCASLCLNIYVCVCGLVSQSWVNELAAAAKRSCNGFVLIKVLCHESGDMLSVLTGTPPPPFPSLRLNHFDTQTEGAERFTVLHHTALDTLTSHREFQGTENCQISS